MANRQFALTVPAAAGAGASSRIGSLELDSRVVEWSGGAGDDDAFIEASNDNANWTRIARIQSTQGYQALKTSALFIRLVRAVVGAGSALVVSVSGAETILSIENGWQMSDQPAVATQATVTRVAAVGIRHALTSLQAIVSAAAGAAVVPTLIYIRDGATGAGAILWAGSLAAAVSTTEEFAINFTQPIIGTAGNAMCIEFAVAGAAGSQETIAGQGYDL
ncbi:MAG: hypothetical protein V1784_07140 [bacterium]